MEEQRNSQFRLMTYNIGGGRKDFGSNFAGIIEIIRQVSPDILVVQEATDHRGAEGSWHNDVRQIVKTGLLDFHFYLGPTLSMTENLDVRKAIFVEGMFKDWQEWRQGNGILSRRGFVGFGNTSKPGRPRNIPIHRVPLYLGNRDTDPRYALVGRVDFPPTYPFVIGTHLSTLLGERGPRIIPGKSEEAELLRIRQARRLLDLLKIDVLDPRKLTFLLGDFNATKNELCISAILEKEGGFMRLAPQNGEVPTHPKVPEPIDHIFIFPPERVVKYDCWIVDGSRAKQGSDHCPVVADILISNLQTKVENDHRK